MQSLNDLIALFSEWQKLEAAKEIPWKTAGTMRKKELKPRISVGAAAAAVFVSNGISVLNVVQDDSEKSVFPPRAS